MAKKQAEIRSGLNETPKELEALVKKLEKALMQASKSARSEPKQFLNAAYQYGLAEKRWRHMQRKIKKADK